MNHISRARRFLLRPTSSRSLARVVVSHEGALSDVAAIDFCPFSIMAITFLRKFLGNHHNKMKAFHSCCH
jgi:hypothetical protein